MRNELHPSRELSYGEAEQGADALFGDLVGSGKCVSSENNKAANIWGNEAVAGAGRRT